MPIAAGKIVAGVLGLGAASVLGFNWITTGCPSGVCPTERAAQAAITAAALETAPAVDSCCATKAAETTQADACCAAEAAVTTVAAPAATPDAPDACCALMAEAATTAAVIPVSAPADPLAAAPEGECCADKGATEPCNEAKACCKENFGIADNAPANP